MAFWLWDQHNSGGAFIMDDDLAHRVYIEADSFEEAEAKAMDLGVYYEGVAEGYDCDCCGDRWYRPTELKFPIQWNEQRAFYDVEPYAEYLKKMYGWGPIDYHIYYKDGSKKTGMK